MNSQARARIRTAWGWSWPRARARAYRSAAQGLAWRLSPAKSQTASRSCLSQAQGKPTARLLPGGRGHAGEAGQRFRSGKAAAAVADLGQQPRSTDLAASRQACEDLTVGVCRELLADLGGQGVDLLVQRGQQGQERSGDVGLDSAVASRCAAWGSHQPGIQLGGGTRRRSPPRPARPPDASPIASRPGLGNQSGPCQEGQANWRIEVGEQPDRARKDSLQMRPSLIGSRHPVTTKSLRARQVRRSAIVAFAVTSQRDQTSPVSPQRVGQHECDPARWGWQRCGTH